MMHRELINKVRHSNNPQDFLDDLTDALEAADCELDRLNDLVKQDMAIMLELKLSAATWIPVGEELPKVGEKVFWRNEENPPMIGTTEMGEDGFYVDRMWAANVSHWMRIPKIEKNRSILSKLEQD